MECKGSWRFWHNSLQFDLNQMSQFATCFFMIDFNIISHLCLTFPNGVSPLVLLLKLLMYVSSPSSAPLVPICHCHDLVTPIIFDSVHISNFSLWIFHWSTRNDIATILLCLPSRLGGVMVSVLAWLKIFYDNFKRIVTFRLIFHVIKIWN
jgi:hypothetical protein